MSYETDRWTELTSNQGLLFTSQLDAAKQAFTNPAAQEAGIVPLYASRYGFQINESQQDFSALMWPDSYKQNTACIVMGSTTGKNTSAFAQVTEEDESYTVEGVAVGLNFGKGANLHGQQLLLRQPNAEEELCLRQVGVNFLLTAFERAGKLASLPPPTMISKARMTGIEGHTTARLFRSLSSLASNLIVAGAVSEQGVFADQTYDLAHTLYKMVISSTAQNSTPEAILWGTSGRPAGAFFESEHAGITVVRRGSGYPETIAVATAGRPVRDSGLFFVEQHLIQPRGVTVDMMALDAELYNPQAIISSLAEIGANPKAADADMQVTLDDAGTRVLEQKLARLLSEVTQRS